jgi:signal peptidase I
MSISESERVSLTPWDAVLFSLLLPGAGHYRAGRIWAGAGWFAFFAIGSLTFIGLLLTSAVASPFPAFGVFLGLMGGYLLMLVDAYYRANDRRGSWRPAVTGILAALPFLPLGVGQFFNRRWWRGAFFLGLHLGSVWGVSWLQRLVPGPGWTVGILLWFPLWRLASVVEAYQDRSRREGGVAGHRRVLMICGLIGVVLSLGRTMLLEEAVGTFNVRTAAMEPVLLGAKVEMDRINDQAQIKTGDQVIIDRLSYRFREPRRGEIILYRADSLTSKSGAYFVQRLVGLPWERVRIDPPKVLINGRPLEDPPMFATLSLRAGGYRLAATNAPHAALQTPADHVDLKGGEYFLLGDNTHNSFDSRYWGPLKRKDIEGRVVKIYWPMMRAGQPLEP